MVEIIPSDRAVSDNEDIAPSRESPEVFLASADASETTQTTHTPAEPTFLFSALTTGRAPISDLRGRLAQTLTLQPPAQTRELILDLFETEKNDPTGAIQQGAAAGMLASLYLNSEPETGSKIAVAVKDLLTNGQLNLPDLADPAAVGYTNNANSAIFNLVRQMDDPVLLARYETARERVLFRDNDAFSSDYLKYGMASGLSAADYEELDGFERLGIRTALGSDQIEHIQEIAQIENTEDRNDAIRDLLLSNAGRQVQRLITAVFADPAAFAKSFLTEFVIGATPVIGQIYEAVEIGQAALQALTALNGIFGIVGGIAKLERAETAQERTVALYGLVGSTRMMTEELTGAAIDLIVTEAAVRGGRGVAKRLVAKPAAAAPPEMANIQSQAASPGGAETTTSNDKSWTEIDLPRAADWDDYFGVKTAAEIKKEFVERNGLDPNDVAGSAGHDWFAHLLQHGNEVDDTNLNLTDIVDYVTSGLVFGQTEAEIRSRMRDTLIRDGFTNVNYDQKALDFIFEQIDHNAALNGVDRAMFVRLVRTDEMDTLVQRPRYLPMDAKPR